MESSGEEFDDNLAKSIDSVSAEPEKSRKGGPTTIADNFLLGSLNHWRSFFEWCWPELGVPLLQIRKRPSSTIADVQEAFKGVKGKPHGDLADVFLRGEPQRITVRTLRKQTMASSKLRYEVQDMQNKRPELQRLCLEAANALSQASETENATIQAELVRRIHTVKQDDERLIATGNECIALEKQTRNGEVYLYCSELLNFLQSKGKRKHAVTPISLAKALAGLPHMRWRHSDTRCVILKKKEDENKKRLVSEFRRAGHHELADQLERDKHRPEHPYAVFTVIELLFRRVRSKSAKSVTDLFRAEVLKLPKKEPYPRDFLCEHWRDLKRAIEEVWQIKPAREFIPHAVTSAFLKNTCGSKTDADRVLDTQEKLPTAKPKRNWRSKQ